MKLYTALTIPSMKFINERKKKHTAVSLFAGCGGASTGLKLAGFDVLYASEFVPHAADTYEKNSNIKVDRRDIRKVKGKEILKRIKLKPGELDCMDMSPPCKLFSSSSGNVRMRDKPNKIVKYSDKIFQRVDDLFDHGIRILKILKPKTFIAENVKGLTSEHNRGFLFKFVQAMDDAGYVVQVQLIDPSFLGVPQMRERVVFIGIRKDLVQKYKLKHAWPKPNRDRMSLQDALPYIYKSHGGASGWMDNTQPHPTLAAAAWRSNLTAVMSSPGIILLESGKHRKLTMKEMRILFSFPADFKFPKYEGKSHNWHESREWERLCRSHAPLAVYRIASTISEHILSKV